MSERVKEFERTLQDVNIWHGAVIKPYKKSMNSKLASLLRPTFAFIRQPVVFVGCNQTEDANEKQREKFHWDSLRLKRQAERKYE